MSSLSNVNRTNALNNAIWRFVGLSLLGVIGGFLVYRTSQKQGEPNIWYLVTVAAICIIIGLIIFIVRLSRINKKYPKGDNNE